MNITARLNKLVELLARQHQPTTGNEPDALSAALNRALDEGRGTDFNESVFGVARELSTASVQGRAISIDEAFALAGVSGELRQQVEAFVSMTPEAQVPFLDGLR